MIHNHSLVFVDIALPKDHVRFMLCGAGCSVSKSLGGPKEGMLAVNRRKTLGVLLGGLNSSLLDPMLGAVLLKSMLNWWECLVSRFVAGI